MFKSTPPEGSFGWLVSACLDQHRRGSRCLPSRIFLLVCLVYLMAKGRHGRRSNCHGGSLNGMGGSHRSLLVGRRQPWPDLGVGGSVVVFLSRQM